MAIEIGFALSTAWSREDRAGDLAQAGEMELRYDFFLGDLWLRVGELDFSARWGWVPILDAAASLWHIVEDLERGEGCAVFEFTEGDHELRFEREADGQVYISSTFTDGRARVRLEDLRSAVQWFSERVLDHALARYPDLKRNTQLPQWYPTGLRS